MSNLTIDNAAVNIGEISNIPYKINREGTYYVAGILSHDLNFYMTNVVEGGIDNLNLNLAEAENLGFDVVPHWIATNFNSKSFQNSINYMLDCAEEDGLLCDGIIFRFNDASYSKNGILYEVLK